MLKANVQNIAENHLREVRPKLSLVSLIGCPPLKGTRIILYVDKCNKIFLQFFGFY